MQIEKYFFKNFRELFEKIIEKISSQEKKYSLIIHELSKDNKKNGGIIHLDEHPNQILIIQKISIKPVIIDLFNKTGLIKTIKIKNEEPFVAITTVNNEDYGVNIKTGAANCLIFE